jgi:magnesium transporter
VLTVVAWLWKGNLFLGVVAGVSHCANILVAATAGALIPMTLRRLGLDPAPVAGVFDTMLADFMGFLIYVGLATLLLNYLM